jgi:hypothetical protein
MNLDETSFIYFHQQPTTIELLGFSLMFDVTMFLLHCRRSFDAFSSRTIAKLLEVNRI